MEENTNTNDLREGDVVSWSWKEPKGNEPYWCKSRIAIFHDGKLHDTFWIHHGSKFIQGGWGPDYNSMFTPPVDRIDFSIIGNIHDMEEIRHGDEVYYEISDVLDMRHANNGNAPVYIKRGAQRSKETMLSNIDGQISEARSMIESLTRKIEWLTEKRHKIDSGDLNVYI